MKKIIYVLVPFLCLAMSACNKVSDDATPSPGNPRPSDTGPNTGSGSAGIGGSSGAGNGGGAIVRNGNVLTFAQAGVNFEIPVTPVFNNPGISVPEVDIAQKFVEKLALPNTQKGRLLRGLIPLGDRKYFNLKEEDLNDEKKAELLAAYKRVAGDLPVGEDYHIVALTIGKETFLLPDFYKLSDSYAKSAILFHEALWVYNPKLPLIEVLRTEVALEKALRSPLRNEKLVYDRPLFETLTKSLGARSLLLTGAILRDLEHGPFKLKIPTLNPADQWELTVRDTVFPVSELVGREENAVKCSVNRDALLHYITKLAKLNPRSAFAQELLTSFADLTIEYYGSCKESVNFLVLNQQKYCTGFSFPKDGIVTLDNCPY